MKAIKTNAGSNGVISNMVPSLQHVYSVSMLIGKVEYVARENEYDKCERKILSKELYVSNYILHYYFFKICLMLMLKINGRD